MRKLIIAAAAALIVASPAARAETSVLVFGFSKHMSHNYATKYNEFNYGLGLELNREGSGWLVGGFALKDSIDQVGWAAYGGYRLRYDFAPNWHIETTLRAGVLRDAYYTGPAALPSIGIGWKNVTIEATVIPPISMGNKGSELTAVVWGRVKF